MPSSATQPRLSTDMHVRLSPALLTSLQLLADKERRTVSFEVRQALEEYVARENGKAMPEKLVPEPMTKSQAAAVARVLAQGDDIVDGEVFTSALRRIFPEHEWRKLIADRENGKSK